MSNIKQDPLIPRKPSPDDLAGIPVCLEEDQPTVRLNILNGKDHIDGATQPHRKPTADDLAGIPVTIEAEEDLTVRPRRHG